MECACCPCRGQVERSHDQNARSHNATSPGGERLNPDARRRLGHLRRIHPMTREQQIALVEEARAARRAEQETTEVAETWTLTMARDQEWAYRNDGGEAATVAAHQKRRDWQCP